jgi:hypothetical protein
MRRHFSVIAAMLFSFGAVSGQEKNDPLQGNWMVVQTERGGRKAPAELLKTLKVVIKGDKLKMSDASLGCARGRSLSRVIAASGRIPPIACGLWLMWLSGLFASNS